MAVRAITEGLPRLLIQRFYSIDYTEKGRELCSRLDQRSRRQTDQIRAALHTVTTADSTS